MRRARVLANHPLTGPTLRYGVAGAAVATVYLGLPLALNSVGMPIQIAIPIAYVLAVSLHFLLQRHFVFRHVTEFALSGREQMARYLAVGSVQYPTTAVATAFLPAVLGVSQEEAYVASTLGFSVCLFLVLRGHVFRPADASEDSC